MWNLYSFHEGLIKLWHGTLHFLFQIYFLSISFLYPFFISFYFNFLYYMPGFISVKLFILLYWERLSAGNGSDHLVTIICWHYKGLLPAWSVDTAMHYSKCYLLTLQLTVADRRIKFFARLLVICSILPFI